MKRTLYNISVLVCFNHESTLEFHNLAPGCPLVIHVPVYMIMCTLIRFLMRKSDQKPGSDVYTPQNGCSHAQSGIHQNPTENHSGHVSKRGAAVSVCSYLCTRERKSFDLLVLDSGQVQTKKKKSQLSVPHWASGLNDSSQVRLRSALSTLA